MRRRRPGDDIGRAMRRANKDPTPKKDPPEPPDREREDELPPCSVCRPRDNETDKPDFVFCDRHGIEDLREQREMMEEHRRKMEEDLAERRDMADER